MWEAFDSSLIILRRFRSILATRLLHFLLLPPACRRRAHAFTPDAEATRNGVLWSLLTGTDTGRSGTRRQDKVVIGVPCDGKPRETALPEAKTCVCWLPSGIVVPAKAWACPSFRWTQSTARGWTAGCASSQRKRNRPSRVPEKGFNVDSSAERSALLEILAGTGAAPQSSQSDAAKNQSLVITIDCRNFHWPSRPTAW